MPKSKPDYFLLGRFIGDWKNELKGLDLDISKIYYAPEDSSNVQNWTGWGYQNPLPLYIVNEGSADVFKKMAAHFKLNNPLASIQSLLPGYMVPLHVDRYSSYNNPESLDGKSETVRVIVALEDWDFGHYFLIGNSVWHQWKKGEAVVWKKGVLHATANVGKRPRHILTITGELNEESSDLFRKTYQEIRL